MKHIVLLLSLVLFALPLLAGEPLSHETDTPIPDSLSVVRSGDEYITSERIMNKNEFREFLKLNDTESYKHFNKGLRLSNVGWGLFAGGFASVVFGAVFHILGEEIVMRTQTINVTYIS